MNCPACAFDNPTGMKFCGNCAAAIGAACPRCGFENPPGFKFCGECAGALGGESGEGGSAGASPSQRSPAAYTPKHLAEKILASKSALEGERKQVTVLFADVKGSMDLAEQVDAEDWHRILNKFFEILTGGVHRFEGTVNQYTGDGIMALFGAPIAHEDHAHRACYAALHLGEELRHYANQLRVERELSFSVRMGINSGEVIVGKIGDDLRMDYTAQGHTVGLAARMEQLAEPGKAFLTEHTASLVAGFFRMEDLGPMQARGAREPVRVFELQGVGPMRTRLDVSRARGLTRFVGRDQEMATLEAALSSALEGSGRVVGVMAEPGTGKSRLSFEFAERCRASGIRVREAQALAHGKSIPFLPILEFLRDLFGVTERDTDEEARHKIAGRVLLLDDAVKEELPILFDFLGVPDPKRPSTAIDPEARQKRLIGLVRRIIQARSREEPAVALFEDMHWIDPGSEAFLENIMETVAGTRTLLLLTFRPEYRAEWMTKTFYQQIPLLPLGPEAITGMLRDLLGEDPSLSDLHARIAAHTGGNPFFIEEVVLSLVEARTLEGKKGAHRLVGSLDALTLPPTVQAVLAARIDRLPEREKQLLNAVAVIGKRFSEGILRRVANLPDMELASALHALLRAEFLYQESLYPEAEYAFKHPLTQEVAYRSQLSERRARLHAEVARALEDLGAEKLGERAALLAYHWEAAGDAAPAARWHRRAAEWAGAKSSAEALRHWRRARELLDTLPRSRETMAEGAAVRGQLLVQAYRTGLLADEVTTLLEEARELAEASGDVHTLAFVVLAAGRYKFFSGAPLEAAPLLEEGIAREDEGTDVGLRIWTRELHGWTYLFLGRSLGEALTHSDEALALGRQDPHAGLDLAGYRPYLGALAVRGSILTALGRLTEAARGLEQTIASAEQYGDWTPCSMSHAVYAQLCDFTGDVPAAVAHGRAAVELAKKTDNRSIRVLAFGALGIANVLDGQWREALDALGQALAIARERRTSLLWEAQLLAHLARAHLGLGDADTAREVAEEAIAVAQRRGTRTLEIEAHLVLGLVLIHAGARREEVQKALDTAEHLVEETGARAYLPFIHLERASLARAARDEATRLRELRKAHRLFVEMGATARAQKVAKEIGA